MRSDEDETAAVRAGVAASGSCERLGERPSARELGHSLVGSRVTVWWEEDEAWYSGTVRAYSDALGEHLVCYDDGEQQQEALDECS